MTCPTKKIINLQAPIYNSQGKEQVIKAYHWTNLIRFDEGNENLDLRTNPFKERGDDTNPFVTNYIYQRSNYYKKGKEDSRGFHTAPSKAC